MCKKYVICLLLTIIFSVTCVSGVTALAGQPDTWQKAIEQANNDLGFEYFKEKNKSGLEINKDLTIGNWSTYKGGSQIDFGSALVYGQLSGMKNGMPRYLGETRGGDEYANAYFPMDSWAGGYIEERNWIKEPWVDASTCSDASEITFDLPMVGDKYLANIVKGMELFYHNILDGSYKNTDWTEYVHVLQPPTNYSFGTGRMWHKDNAGKIWYLAVPIAPFSKIGPAYIDPKHGENGTADGCFLDYPQKVGNNMEVYIIRGPRTTITEPVYVAISIYLLENVNESVQFSAGNIPANIGWGELIFDEVVEFLPDKPYWVKKVTYPVPLAGHKSGILVQTGYKEIEEKNAVDSFTWNSDAGLNYGSHTMSESEYMDYLPWDRIEAEYGIKRLPRQ